MKEGETVGLIDPNKLTVPLLYISSQPYTLEELNQLNSNLKIDNAYNFLNELKYNDQNQHALARLKDLETGK